MLSNCLQVRSAPNKHNVLTRLRQVAAKIRADYARTNHNNTHRVTHICSDRRSVPFERRDPISFSTSICANSAGAPKNRKLQLQERAGYYTNLLTYTLAIAIILRWRNRPL